MCVSFCQEFSGEDHSKQLRKSRPSRRKVVCRKTFFAACPERMAKRQTLSFFFCWAATCPEGCISWWVRGHTAYWRCSRSCCADCYHGTCVYAVYRTVTLPVLLVVRHALACDRSSRYKMVDRPSAVGGEMNDVAGYEKRQFSFCPLRQCGNVRVPSVVGEHVSATNCGMRFPLSPWTLCSPGKARDRTRAMRSNDGIRRRVIVPNYRRVALQ